MGIGTTGYNIFLIAHLITAVVAFGPLFLYAKLRRAGQLEVVAGLHMKVVFPSLVLLWVLGMGLAGMSDNVWELSQLWLVLSIINWIVLVAVSWFLIRPAMTDRSEQSAKMLSAGVGITHLLLVVGLYLMVFKPGL